MLYRGDVYLTDIDLPPRAAGQGGRRRKYVVILHDERDSFFSYAEDTAVVVGSSVIALNPARLHRYEVGVSADTGPFPEDTIIDCRWPFAISKGGLPDQPVFHLDDAVMRRVNGALMAGLGMLNQH